MKALRKLLLLVVVLVVIAVAVGLGVDAYLAATKLDPILEEDAAVIEKHWPSIEADLKALGAHPFFDEERSGGDAGPTLNPLLPWDGAGGRKTGPLKERFEALPDEVKALTQGDFNPEAELSEAQAAVVGALDLGWMRGLLDNGYWSLMGDSPLAKQDPVRIASAPTPTYVWLFRWSKLRLLQAKLAARQEGTEGDPVAEAIREVKHLAWLTMSTESLIGAMVGVTLLRVAHASSPEKSGLKEEDIERAKRALFAAATFGSWTAPDAARARFVKTANAHLPIARCIAWTEGGMSYLVKPFLEGRFSSYYAELDALKPGGACRFGVLTQIQAQSKKDPWSLLANEETGETGDLGGREWYVRLPIVRSIVGTILATIAAPDFLRLYREAQPKAA